MPVNLELRFYDFFDPAIEPFVRECAQIWREVLPEVGGEAAFLMDYDREIAKGRPSHNHAHDLAAVLDGLVVAVAVLDQHLRDNLTEAGANICVLPAYRRRGIATRILDELITKATELGITRLSVWTVTATGRAPLGDLFAASHGFHEVDDYRESVLHLPLDPARLAALVADAARAMGSAYRVESFTGRVAEQHHEDMALMRRRMSTDAPQSIDREEAQRTAADIAATFDRLERAGTTRLTTLAFETATSRAVAFSEMEIEPGAEDASQGETLVLRENRGHRLGLATKLATLRLLAETCSRVTHVNTGNHRDNAPMLAVNEMLGFEEFASSSNWIRTLSTE